VFLARPSYLCLNLRMSGEISDKTMRRLIGHESFLMPKSQAGALTPFPDRAGTASSLLLGFAQQTCSAIAAAAIGLYLGASAWPVAGTIAAMGCLALLIWAATRRVRSR
jgi:hypothetical protein